VLCLHNVSAAPVTARVPEALRQRVTADLLMDTARPAAGPELQLAPYQVAWLALEPAG